MFDTPSYLILFASVIIKQQTNENGFGLTEFYYLVAITIYFITMLNGFIGIIPSFGCRSYLIENLGYLMYHKTAIETARLQKNKIDSSVNICSDN